MLVREIKGSDINAIVNIYNHYVENTVITFEEELISSDMMLGRVEKLLDIGFPWLVIESEGEVKGYAYASQWHVRSAYRYTVETTIYLSPDAVGQGLGRRLHLALSAILEAREIKNIIAVIALPNTSSVRLHERLGFQKVGEFNNIGFKFGRNVSVGYWQRALHS